MKVKDLIERLQDFDQELEIRFGKEDSEDAYDITDVAEQTDPELGDYICIEG